MQEMPFQRLWRAVQRDVQNFPRGGAYPRTPLSGLGLHPRTTATWSTGPPPFSKILDPLLVQILQCDCDQDVAIYPFTCTLSCILSFITSVSPESPGNPRWTWSEQTHTSLSFCTTPGSVGFSSKLKVTTDSIEQFGLNCAVQRRSPILWEHKRRRFSWVIRQNPTE